MRNQIVTEKGGIYLYVQVHPEISYAFISSTGKSLTFRVDGTYIKANGTVIGAEGEMTGYISSPLHNKVEVIRHRHYQKSDIIHHDFGDGMDVETLKIQIRS